MRADVLTKSNDDLFLRVKATLYPFTSMGCCAGTNNPYYVLSRGRPDNTKEFVRVFQSDAIIDNPSPSWPRKKHKMAQICNSNVELPLKISFYSHIPNGTDELYGEATTTIAFLLTKVTPGAPGTVILDLTNPSGAKAGLVYLENV